MFHISNLAYFTIGTSLFAGALATSNSAYLHIRKENFSKKPAILVAFGAAISAFIAPFFVVKVKCGNNRTYFCFSNDYCCVENDFRKF